MSSYRNQDDRRSGYDNDDQVIYYAIVWCNTDGVCLSLVIYTVINHRYCAKFIRIYIYIDILMNLCMHIYIYIYIYIHVGIYITIINHYLDRIFNIKVLVPRNVRLLMIIMNSFWVNLNSTFVICW